MVMERLNRSTFQQRGHFWPSLLAHSRGSQLSQLVLAKNLAELSIYCGNCSIIQFREQAVQLISRQSLKMQILYFLTILLVPVLSFNFSLYEEPKLCERNRFEYFSTYVLGRQQDLTETFKQLENKTSLPLIIYKQELFRTYTIKNFAVKFSFFESKQRVDITQVNTVRVSGGTVHIKYTFDWEKKQLGQSIEGTGEGSVTSDPTMFEKTLQTTDQHQLVWKLTKVTPLTISNSLTLSDFKPYTKPDFDVVIQMLNSLQNNHTTVKLELTTAINKHYEETLAEIVKHDETWTVDPIIDYSYADPSRGLFTVSFDNILQTAQLANDGLSLHISQTIQGDKKFQCGDPVPDKPQDIKKYGGHQQFISNSLLKSTLKYALERGFLDVVLSEQFWQSRAFQFYIGDLHEVMPSTKNMSSYEKITGKCKALSDEAFKFEMKDQSTYNVTVNFTCTLNVTNKKMLGMNLLTNFDVKPILYPKYLDFTLSEISGVPTFQEQEGFKIVEKELALFMVTETLNIAKNCKVIGSGYRASSRKYPNLAIRKSYIMLYDSSTK